MDNTQIDTETVMTSEEQSESSVHLVNNTTSEIIWTEIIFVAKKSYEIIFERVGNLCKENKSDSLGLLSDYQIMVRSEDREVIQVNFLSENWWRNSDSIWYRDNKKMNYYIRRKDGVWKCCCWTVGKRFENT